MFLTKLFKSKDLRDFWGRGPGEITAETSGFDNIDMSPGDLGVTCQMERQHGCISTQARHKPADKMQGVGHGDKIIII